METFDKSSLKPGDVLIYGGHGLVDLVINLKTWSFASHVEIAVTENLSIASRNGIGVGLYSHRSKGLRYVLRPNILFDFDNGMAWFKSCANGKPYAWSDLLGFINIRLDTGDGLICSEFAAMFFDHCAAPLFSPQYPRGVICPRDNLISPRLDLIWSFDGSGN
jgi:hypothetical protein